MKNIFYAVITFIGLSGSSTYTIDTQSVKETAVAVKLTVTSAVKTAYQKTRHFVIS